MSYLESSLSTSTLQWLCSKSGYVGARGCSYGELELMSRCAELTPTEASRLVVEASRGRMGRVEIREGNRELVLTPCALITFYFKPQAVYELSEVARLVEGSGSLAQADKVLR